MSPKSAYIFFYEKELPLLEEDYKKYLKKPLSKFTKFMYYITNRTYIKKTFNQFKEKELMKRWRVLTRKQKYNFYRLSEIDKKKYYYDKLKKEYYEKDQNLYNEPIVVESADIVNPAIIDSQIPATIFYNTDTSTIDINLGGGVVLDTSTGAIEFGL